jgi:hypothetical protein
MHRTITVFFVKILSPDREHAISVAADVRAKGDPSYYHLCFLLYCFLDEIRVDSTYRVAPRISREEVPITRVSHNSGIENRNGKGCTVCSNDTRRACQDVRENLVYGQTGHLGTPDAVVELGTRAYFHFYQMELRWVTERLAQDVES